MIQNLINKFLKPYEDVTFDPKNSPVLKLLDQIEDSEKLLQAKKEVRMEIMLGNYKRYGIVTLSYLLYASLPFILYYEWKFLKKYFKK